MKDLRFLSAAVMITAVCAFAAASAFAALPSSTPKLRVTPATGTPTSTFTFAFRAPAASGRSAVGGMLRHYDVSASGPAGASGCRDYLSLVPTATRTGERLRVRLKPPGAGARWCVGEWSGTVDEVAVPACGPVVARAGRIMCPQYIELLARLGTFEFRVTAAAG
jgi:hypothetical protein